VLLVCNIPQALQAEGSWHEAERHFCEAKEWKGAVAMYRQQGSWDDALRVAKVLGGLEAAKQVGTGTSRVRNAPCLSEQHLTGLHTVAWHALLVAQPMHALASDTALSHPVAHACSKLCVGCVSRWHMRGRPA
jgi:hypothetical protein